MRAAGWIVENRIDEVADDPIVALDVDLDRAGLQISHGPGNRKACRKARNRITKTDPLHAAVQLEDDAPYALTSARAPFAARISIPLSPE